MRIAHVVQIPCPDRQTHTTDRFASSGEGLWDQTLIHVYQVCQCAATPVVISASLRRRPARIPTLTLTPLACRSFSLEIAQEPTYRWVAGRLLSLASSMIAQPARSVPSLALRRAGLPSCASQQKSDGHQLPCGGPLPEHETTTLN